MTKWPDDHPLGNSLERCLKRCYINLRLCYIVVGLFVERVCPGECFHLYTTFHESRLDDFMAAGDAQNTT